MYTAGLYVIGLQFVVLEGGLDCWELGMDITKSLQKGWKYISLFPNNFLMQTYKIGILQFPYYMAQF